MSPTTTRFLALAVGLPLLAWTLTASANEVYKWKDAKGVTHYGDVPPAGAKAVRSTLKVKTPTPVATPVAVAENPQCQAARGNLAVLQGKGPVGMDHDRDGKPDTTMDATERAKQTKLAEAGVEAYCAAPQAAPKP